MKKCPRAQQWIWGNVFAILPAGFFLKNLFNETLNNEKQCYVLASFLKDWNL